MKVIALQTIQVDRVVYPPKSVFELENSEAERLLNLVPPVVKMAEEQSEIEEPVEEPVEELEKVEELVNLENEDEVAIEDLSLEELREEIKIRGGAFNKADSKLILIEKLTLLLA